MSTPVQTHPWGFFRNAAEADEWLPFDASEHEQEQAWDRSPDRFDEWLQWAIASDWTAVFHD